MKNILIISISLFLVASSCSKKDFSFYCKNKTGEEIINQFEIEKALVSTSVKKNKEYYDHSFQFILIKKEGKDSFDIKSIHANGEENNSLTELIKNLYDEEKIDFKNSESLLPIIFCKSKKGIAGVHEPNWKKYRKTIKKIKSDYPSIVILKPVCMIGYGIQ